MEPIFEPFQGVEVKLVKMQIRSSVNSPNKQSAIKDVFLLLQILILWLFFWTCFFFSTSKNPENILQLKCHSDTPVLKL